jgi:hypothetical protein
MLIQTLSSFGSLDLHIVTLNIENITTNLRSTLAFQDVPNVENISFYVAMDPNFAQTLSTEGTNGEGMPRWFNFTIQQLARSLDHVKELEVNGAELEQLHTNLDKWVFATRALHRNKKKMYQTRHKRKHRNLQTQASIRSRLEPLSPYSPSFRICKTDGRNSLAGWDHEDYPLLTTMMMIKRRRMMFFAGVI